MRNYISLYCGPSRHQPVFTTRIVFAVLLLWPFAITFLTVVMAVAGIEWVYARSGRGPAFDQSMLAALFVTAIVVAPTLLVRLVRPQLTLAVLVVMTAGVVIALATGAGALPDLFVVVVIGLAAHELGRLALDRLVLHVAGPPLESLVLVTGLGAGLLGLIALALGLLGWLTRPAVILLLAPLIAMAIWRCGQAIVRRTHTYRRRAFLAPAFIPSRVDTILLSLTAAFLAVGTILAVTPEIHPDAVREHLPLARIFAEQGSVPVLPLHGTSRWPVSVPLLFATGMLLHGPLAAKLIHAGALWLVVASAGALGTRYAGLTAGITAAALVASLPVVMWEAGSAYVDAFPTLYALLGALCLLHWQRQGGTPWLLLLGMMIGFGVAAKLTFAFTGAALVLALLLVGHPRKQGRSRLAAAGWVAVGGLAVGIPWLARSIWLAGEVPGFTLFMDAVGRGAGESPVSLSDLPGFGVGRNPIRLITLPFELTFNSGVFGQNGPGFIGVALLLLLPTLVFLPRRRATATLAVVVLVPYLFWFLTAQYIRYLLPTLALLAPLLGTGFARFREAVRRYRISAAPVAANVATGSLVFALGSSLLFFGFQTTRIPGFPGGLPVALVLGQQRQDAYLAATLRDYTVLQRLNRLVLPGTRVAVLSKAPSQLYSDAILVTQETGLPELVTARSEAELSAALDRKGIEFVIVDRPLLPDSSESSLLLQPDFLEEHATIVFAANDVYLYWLQARAEREG